MHARLLVPEKKSLHSIASVMNLCIALNITSAELTDALSLPEEDRYTPKLIPKADGTNRVVHNPHHKLRKIQRRINKRILANTDMIAWPDHIFGSVPNHFEGYQLIAQKDYVACARVHCGSRSIMSMDIMSFFDNIHQIQVQEIFEDFFHYPTDVSETLAELCCHKGSVIQGALTSSYLATLVLHKVEGRVVDRLMRKGLRYTRLVDDITVSSEISNYDFAFASRLIEDMLIETDLPIHHGKTRKQFLSTSPLMVHGLRVAFREPRLPSNEVRNIRSAVHNVERLAKEDLYRMSHPYRRDFNRCMGRVNKLSRVGHRQHEQLVNRLRKVVPLPSHNDIKRSTRIVEKLEADFVTKSDQYWYARRFHLAHERITVLKRIYSKTAAELRKRLRKIKPKYE